MRQLAYISITGEGGKDQIREEKGNKKGRHKERDVSTCMTESLLKFAYILIVSMEHALRLVFQACMACLTI